jgi:peptidoglycan hydrolase CwlO-like protein
VALAAASAHAEKLRQTIADTEVANKALQAKDARAAFDISALHDKAEVLRQQVAAHQSNATALRAQMADAETAHKNQIAAFQEQLRKSKKALTIFVLTAFVVLAVMMAVMW